MQPITAKEIHQLILQHNSIVIYRHIDPDYDAIGASYGLQQLIETNYPGKVVYIYGTQVMSQCCLQQQNQHVSLATIQESLTISLDTSNLTRSDDETITMGQSTLKIDHHLNSDPFTQFGYIDEKSESTCGLIVKIALELHWSISAKAAEYLLAGILTDSCGLTAASVSPATLLYCAKLLETGLSIAQLSHRLFDISEKDYQLESALRQKVEIIDDTAFYLCDQAFRLQHQLLENEPKYHVHILSNLKNITKYAAFSQLDNGQWTASLRSKAPSIVHIANQFSGGGHHLACGIPEMSEKQMHKCIELFIASKETS